MNKTENGKTCECIPLHVQNTGMAIKSHGCTSVVKPTILRYAAKSVALPVLLTLHMCLWVLSLKASSCLCGAGCK